MHAILHMRPCTQLCRLCKRWRGSKQETTDIWTIGKRWFNVLQATYLVITPDFRIFEGAIFNDFLRFYVNKDEHWWRKCIAWRAYDDVRTMNFAMRWPSPGCVLKKYIFANVHPTTKALLCGRVRILLLKIIQCYTLYLIIENNATVYIPTKLIESRYVDTQLP